MNSPLKQKIKKFSNLDKQCQTKIALIDAITSKKFKQSTNTFLSWLSLNQKVQQQPIFLEFNSYLNIMFDQYKQKTIIVLEKNILRNLVKDKMIVIMVETNFQINATLIINLNGFQKKFSYKLKGVKAIPLDRYHKQDVKLILSVDKLNFIAQARFHLDIIRSQHNDPKNLNRISPKKHKELINEFVKQNRGRSAEIITRRQLSRQSSTRQRLIMTAKRQKTLTYNPSQNFSNKKDKSDLRLFQIQKIKYMNHIKKMSSNKEILFKQKQEQYIYQKQQHAKMISSLILLSKFYKQSRQRILQRMRQKIKRIKVIMLALDFCGIMKSKLRFKITQKARYRMAILNPIELMTHIFYGIGQPKAEKKVFQALMQIETLKTLIITSEKSINYIKKTIIIQKYVRNKKINIKQRVNILIDQLIQIYNIPKEKLNLSRQDIIQKYLKICLNEIKSCWVLGIHKKINILLPFIQ